MLKALAEHLNGHAQAAAHVGFVEKEIRVHENLPGLVVGAKGQYRYFLQLIGIALALLPPFSDLRIACALVAFDFDTEAVGAGVVTTVAALHQIAPERHAAFGQSRDLPAEFTFGLNALGPCFTANGRAVTTHGNSRTVRPRRPG